MRKIAYTNWMRFQVGRIGPDLGLTQAVVTSTRTQPDPNHPLSFFHIVRSETLNCPTSPRPVSLRNRDEDLDDESRRVTRVFSLRSHGGGIPLHPIRTQSDVRIRRRRCRRRPEPATQGRGLRPRKLLEIRSRFRMLAGRRPDDGCLRRRNEDESRLQKLGRSRRIRSGPSALPQSLKKRKCKFLVSFFNFFKFLLVVFDVVVL